MRSVAERKTDMADSSTLARLEKHLVAGGVCKLALAVALASFATVAPAATWTGAQDAFWTNSANWAEGTVPGKYYAPDGTLTGTKEMIATFGACTGAVEIDLDGLFSIGKVHVTGADAPRYTFGTSTTQVLPIEAVVNSSLNQFTVDSSVTRAPIVRAIFGFGNGIGEAGGNTSVYLYNNSSDTLVINDFGYMQRASGGDRTRATFAGTGPISVNGVWVKAPVNAVQDLQSYICSGSSVGPTFNKSFSFPGLLNSSASGSKMTIADGVTITTSNSWGDLGSLPFTINGPGTLAITPGKFVQCYDSNDIYLNCRLALTSTPGTDRGMHVYGQGGYHINNSANTLSGTLQYYGSNASSAFVFDKIGRIGETCPLYNVSTIRANRHLKVVFTGSTPDVTDRVFEIGPKDVANNWNNDQHSFVLEQAGSASLTVESSPSLKSAPADGIHKFTLTGNGAGEGIWAGVLADGTSTKLQVTKAGAGRWTYTAANTYTGDTIVNAGTLAIGATGTLASSPVKLAGGTLEVSGTKTLTSIDAAGASTLSLAAGAALTVGAITQSSGSIAVTTGDGSSLVCLALANTAPGWITVNGYPAEFDSSGRLKRQSYAVTDTIAARGDTVPNDSSAVVGITSPGTDGADELEAADTTVAALVQKTSVPAVISLAGGRTLSAGTLAVDEDGSALTIGADVGEGTLAAASSTLTFDAANADPDASITVNSALSVGFSGKIEKKGGGDLSFRAPFAFAGEMEVTAGRVILTNEAALSLAATLTGGQPGSSKVQVDGPGSITFPHKNPDYHGDFVLSGGTVQLDKDDLTVTHFGANDGDLVVTNGASLVLDGAKGQGDDLRMNGKRIRFSGHGPNGSGALVANEFFFNFMDNVLLDGDTTFACTKGKGNPGYIAFNGNGPRSLDMGGHVLNVISGDGNGGYFVFKDNTSITNAGQLVIGEKFTLSAYDGAWFGEGSAAPIIMCPTANLAPYRLAAQDRKWEIRGTNGAPSRITVQSTVGLAATNTYRFNGSVTFAPQEPGAMACWQMIQHGSCKLGPLFFAGQIIGDGSFLLDRDYRGDFHVEGAGNTFTGGIVLTNSWLYSAVCLHWPSSIPDYSKLVLSGGRAVAYAGNWSDAQIVSLANTASLTNGAVVTVNTTGCAGNEHEMTLSDEGIASGTFGIGHEGPGRLAVAGGWTKPVRLVSYGGELALTGDGERKVESVTLGHPYMSGTNATLSIEGGSVTLGNGPVAVGFGQLVTNDGYLATLKISNASISAPTDSSACAFPQISVGYGCEPGFMEIGNGAEVRTTMTVGHTHVNSAAAGMGAVVQNGGTVVVTTRTGQEGTEKMYIANGNGTWGAYALEAGSLDARQMRYTALAYGLNASGSFFQSGGNAKFGAFCVGWGERASAVYYMTNGTASVNSLQIPYVNWGGKGSLSTFTIEGGEMTVSSGNTVPMAQANPENDPTDYGTTAIVNLLGGTLHATLFSKKNTYGIIPEVVHAYVNFDGGVLSANGSNDLFGQERWGMDAVTAFSRGAEIAVEGSYTSKVRVPISAPTGNGVASVVWAGTSAAEFKYLGMPTVDIIGDGYGASAVALFDRASGRVTGIKVVSPGCGYTEAKAVIRSEALCSAKSVKATWHTNVCVLTSSTPASGGLKKSGTGTLELYATNTYCGATTIAGGTLKLMYDDVIPAGSQLVLAGGTLDLNGKAASFGSIGGTAGTVTGGNVSLSSSWTVDVADLAQGRYPVLTGNASFAPGATVTFVNTSLLDENHRGGYPFLSVSGTVDNPPVKDSSLPAPWCIIRSGSVFKVVYPRGTVLTFR